MIEKQHLNSKMSFKMKVLKFSLFIMSVFYMSSLYGITEYNIGDELYVIAKTGLNLRSEPSLKGEIVEKIEYGEILTAKQEKHPYWPRTLDSIQLFKQEEWYKSEGLTQEYWFKGQWVKVEYRDNIGFIFDAYLTNNQPFEMDKMNNIEDFGKYVMRNYNQIDSILYKYEIDIEHERTKMIYDSGDIVEFNVNAKSGSTTIYTHHFSEEEIMLYTYYLNENSNSDDRFYLIKSDSVNRTYYFEGEISGVYIRILEGMAIISYSGWC